MTEEELNHFDRLCLTFGIVLGALVKVTGVDAPTFLRNTANIIEKTSQQTKGAMH